MLRGAVLLSQHPDMLPQMENTNALDARLRRRARPARPAQQPGAPPSSSSSSSSNSSSSSEDEEEEDQPKKEAKEADMQYARMVCGGAGMRSLSSVWGPIDGTGLNYVDNKVLQEKVFDYIRNMILQEMSKQAARSEKKRRDRRNAAAAAAAATIPPNVGQNVVAEASAIMDVRYDNGGTVPRFAIRGGKRKVALMRTLGGIARQAKEEFNEGWNELLDVGITNETLNAEIQVVQTLRLQAVACNPIAQWDAIFPSLDPLLR